MARGNVSEEKAARMAAWFARHMVDLDAPAANPDHPDYPSPGVVAHALWGGGNRTQSERAMAWAERNRPTEKAVPNNREYKQTLLTPNTVNDRTVTGVFSVYGNIDSYSDIAMPGMMAKTLRERGDRILHLWQHNMEEPPIAVIESIRELTRAQLPAEVIVRAPDAMGGAEVTRRYLDTPRANEVLTAIQQGSPLEMSFAFNPMIFDFTERSDAPLGVVRNLREIRLLETSDVLFGANSATVARRSMPIVTLLEALRVAVKAGARHSTRDNQLINQIAEAAIELGATNVVLKTSVIHDEETMERAAVIAPELRSDRRWQYQARAAMAALSLLKKG
jgi:HK97 family phage prohead protease